MSVCTTQLTQAVLASQKGAVPRTGAMASSREQSVDDCRLSQVTTWSCLRLARRCPCGALATARDPKSHLAAFLSKALACST